MSQQNVELVSALFAAAGRGEREAVLSLYDPAVEFDVTSAGIAGVMEETV